MTLHAGALTDLIERIFTAAGVDPREARLVAAHVVDAEARGYVSQGLIRVPAYVKWARAGQIAPRTRLTIEHETPATLVVDAHNGWGHVAAMETMRLCVERAKTAGTCLAVVRNTNHIGRLGYYVEEAAVHDMIGLIACSGNPESSWVAPWGGTRPLFGTNPIAIGFPRRDGPPVVVDVSTTQGARGNVLLAQKLGQPLPDGWAFDAAGHPTRDPQHALPPHGTLAPLGGHKGYALAVAVEVLCGVLAGMWPPDPSANFIGAIRIEAFLPLETYYESLAGLSREITAGPTRPGFDEISLPGEGSARRQQRSSAEGVRVAPEVWQEIAVVARELGIITP